jgi:hypothetical protein
LPCNSSRLKTEKTELSKLHTNNTEVDFAATRIRNLLHQCIMFRKLKRNFT